MAYTPLSLKPVGFPGNSADGRDPKVSILWTYKTEDAMAATVDAAGYIADAKNRKMLAGDTVIVTTMSAGAPSTVFITSVVAITAGAANLANGTSLTLTDSD